MTRWSSAIAFAAALTVPATALAQDLPHSINESPRRAGTEQEPKYQTTTERIRPGWEVGAQVGGGIGVGLGARAGYSFVPGLYAGGSMMHFLGTKVATLVGDDTETQTLFGGDLGYKLFPEAQRRAPPVHFRRNRHLRRVERKSSASSTRARTSRCRRRFSPRTTSATLSCRPKPGFRSRLRPCTSPCSVASGSGLKLKGKALFGTSRPGSCRCRSLRCSTPDPRCTCSGRNAR